MSEPNFDDQTLPEDVFERDEDLERTVRRRRVDDDGSYRFSDRWLEPEGK